MDAKIKQLLPRIVMRCDNLRLKGNARTDAALNLLVGAGFQAEIAEDSEALRQVNVQAYMVSVRGYQHILDALKTEETPVAV